jgi:hypothetical protein
LSTVFRSFRNAKGIPIIPSNRPKGGGGAVLVTQLKRQRRGKPFLATFLSLDAGSVSDGCSNFFVLRDQLHETGLFELNPCSLSADFDPLERCSCRGQATRGAYRLPCGRNFRLLMTTRPSFAERLVIVTRRSTRDLGKKTTLKPTQGKKSKKNSKSYTYVGKGYARFRWLTQALLAACRRTLWAAWVLRATVPKSRLGYFHLSGTEKRCEEPKTSTSTRTGF